MDYLVFILKLVQYDGSIGETLNQQPRRRAAGYVVLIRYWSRVTNLMTAAEPVPASRCVAGSGYVTLATNQTYYRMPTVDGSRRLLEAGGQGRTFAVKAIETLTKLIHPDKWQEEAKTYIKAIEPLIDAGRLEAVLFQFPDTFSYTDENRKYMDRLFRAFEGIPSVAE